VTPLHAVSFRLNLEFFLFQVDPSLIGSTLGLSAALGSLTRIVSPAAGGYLIQLVGPSSPAIACAILCVYLVHVASKLGKMQKQPPSPVWDHGGVESGAPTKKMA
jgi:hypothetical protein